MAAQTVDGPVDRASTVHPGDHRKVPHALTRLSIESSSRRLGDALARAAHVTVSDGAALLHAPARSGNDQRDADDPFNIQVNDPALDNIQVLDGVPSLEGASQTETSLVALSEHDLVVGYNSTANERFVSINHGEELDITHVLVAALSVSHDGGRTWTSGFLPPPAGSIITLGDPSLVADRAGSVYYAMLAFDAGFRSAIAVGKSTDRGDTFGPATIVALDPGADAHWMAAGADPRVKSRDNIYVTWTSFSGAGSRLMFSRSIDQGATWSTAKEIFAPVDDGVMSSFVQFSTPVVDASTGRLYVPFLHFSDSDADDVRVLASDDGGETFGPLAFNVPGAPDPFAFPVVRPGRLNDCGIAGGFQTTVTQNGPTPGRFGFPRYRQASIVALKPAAVADAGRLLLVFNASTSPFFGDGPGSEIMALYSENGGTTWAAPVTIAASTAADVQHFHPTVTMARGANEAEVAYYVQQGDERIRTDIARVHLQGNRVRVLGASRLSTTASDLPPTNISPGPPDQDFTGNFDSFLPPCYALGNYMSAAMMDGEAVAAWGDTRRTWVGPPDSLAPGPHSQTDVFFGTADH